MISPSDFTARARDIRHAVATARKMIPHLSYDFAERAIRENKSVEHVKSDLFRIIVANVGVVRQ